MNFQFYLEKLQDSENFEKFMKTNPDAYFCSGFFIIDKEHNDNKIHLDYFVPKDGKIISFQLEQGLQQVPVEMLDKTIPKEVSTKYDFEFDDIEEMISKEIENRGIKNKVQKYLLSLQKIDSKDVLAGTIFISLLGLIKVQIDLKDMKIIQFEKKSFLDMINVIKKDKKK